MIVKGLGDVSSLYGASGRTSLLQRQVSNEVAPSSADKVTISDAAKSLLVSSNSDQEIQNRIKQIESKPAIERSQDENEYISKNDSRLAEIQGKIKEKGFESLLSDEVDYMQKATGFVNTMAYLSPGERALYDEMVSKGEGKAAGALSLVGMSRIGMEGQGVTLSNGKTFDPTNTEVTAASIRNFYKYMFVGSDGQPDKQLDRQFEALASYLDKRSVTS